MGPLSIVCGICDGFCDRFNHLSSFIDFLRPDRVIGRIFVSSRFGGIRKRKTGVGSVCVSGVGDYRLEGGNVYAELGFSGSGRRGFDLGFFRLRWVFVSWEVRTLSVGWGRSGVLGVCLRCLIEKIGRGAGEWCG